MPVNDPQGLRTGAAVSYAEGVGFVCGLADRLGVCRGRAAACGRKILLSV